MPDDAVTSPMPDTDPAALAAKARRLADDPDGAMSQEADDMLRDLASAVESLLAERAHLQDQIDDLAAFFMNEAPELIGEGGAVENAIHHLRRLLIAWPSDA